MLTNLARDNLSEKCFQLLLTDNVTSVKGNLLYDLAIEEASTDTKINLKHIIGRYFYYVTIFANSISIASAYKFSDNYCSVMTSSLKFVSNWISQTDKDTSAKHLYAVTYV